MDGGRKGCPSRERQVSEEGAPVGSGHTRVAPHPGLLHSLLCDPGRVLRLPVGFSVCKLKRGPACRAMTIRCNSMLCLAFYLSHNK